jgi:putative ABC transport system ATP-binding protein
MTPESRQLQQTTLGYQRALSAYDAQFKPTDAQLKAAQAQIQSAKDQLARLQEPGADALAAWRGENVGIIFQFFQMLPALSLLENVILPMDLANKYSTKERRHRAEYLLELVGLSDQMLKLPSAVSGGQQQRAAIARALANDPPLLVADEPTGNLASRASHDVFDLFNQVVGQGKTMLRVTHDKELAQHVPRVVEILDGRITRDEYVGRPEWAGF